MKNEFDSENDIVVYNAPMLPNVDYQNLINDSFSLSITDLEAGIRENCQDFLEALKLALLKEKMIQTPELLLAHLCAYLGTMAVVHTVHDAEKLLPLMIEIIQHQAHEAYNIFNQYATNGDLKENLDELREVTPGSVLVQTIRLGRLVWDMLEELKDNRSVGYSYQAKQKEFFCPQEILVKIMLYLSGKFCAEWREQLAGLSDNYVINQLAIQIGWLMGYFSYISKEPVDTSRYFEYGLPVIELYREFVYKSMKSFAEAKHAKEAEEEQTKAEALLKEIHILSERAHQQAVSPLNNFQKHFFMAKMEIENELIRLVSQGGAIKIVLMSIFYFWFDLALSFIDKDKEVCQEETFSHMSAIIDVVKDLIRKKPTPTLSQEVIALNKKMQKLKEYMPDPESLDKVSKETVREQTEEVNTVIFNAIEKCIQKNIHPKAIANALFNYWLRFSVFFGVSERDWQKMDYYFVDILEAADEYVDRISTGGEHRP